MSTTLITLLNAAAATGVGVSHTLPNVLYKGGAHNIEVSGTFVGTVELEGRINAIWYSLISFTGAGLVNINGVFSEIRGNVTAYTSGAISMAVRYGLEEDYDPVLSNIRNETILLLARLTATRAGLLDNLTGLDGSVAASDKSIKDLRRELIAKNKL